MLQLITHRNERCSDIELVKFALEGGCRWVQLRMKGATDEEIRKTAFEVKGLCLSFGATLILDDRIDLALEVEADGVHLGKNDIPVGEARKLAGENFIIGGTANLYEDMVAIAQSGGNYIGLGPFRFTTTKKNLSPVLGLDGYRKLISRFRKEGYTLPVVAIGGITEEDIPDMLETGINGIALSSEILNAGNPVEKTKRIIKITN
jgi:thiamine-phosphate pyrophosphorylase